MRIRNLFASMAVVGLAAALAGCDAWTAPVGEGPVPTPAEHLVELERQHAAASRRLDELSRLESAAMDKDREDFDREMAPLFARIPPGEPRPQLCHGGSAERMALGYAVQEASLAEYKLRLRVNKLRKAIAAAPKTRGGGR